MNDSLFIETLKVVDGRFVCPEFHLKRMESTQQEIFGRTVPLQLEDTMIPVDKRQGVVKCRVIYGAEVQQIDYEFYYRRSIHSLKLVDGGLFDYHLKYADRTVFTRLLEQRGHCDEILIIRQGEITDTSFSNVVFYDGVNYVTPRSFLLNGTKRQFLLQTGRIIERRIVVEDLKNYEYLYLINAMLEIEDGVKVDFYQIMK